MANEIGQEEYVAMRTKALEQLRKGESLTGKGGAFAPDKDTNNTTTTGTTTNGCKKLTFADILTLKERFDDAEIPLDERYLVLHPKHVSYLLLADIELFKDLTNIKDGEPFKFAGFGCFSFSQMPVYRVVGGVLNIKRILPSS